MFLRSRLPKSVDLVTLQAPIQTSKPADKDVARVPGPYYQWWIDAIDASGPDEVQASAQKALEYAAAFVASHGPFDAVLGFSQGAAMATILTNFLARNKNQDGAEGGGDGGGETEYPWLGTICVCSGSIPCKDWENELLARPLTLPSLHVLGERDQVGNVMRHHFPNSSFEELSDVMQLPRDANSTPTWRNLAYAFASLLDSFCGVSCACCGN